jgi:hypothetical protein
VIYLLKLKRYYCSAIYPKTNRKRENLMGKTLCQGTMYVKEELQLLGNCPSLQDDFAENGTSAQ